MEHTRRRRHSLYIFCDYEDCDVTVSFDGAMCQHHQGHFGYVVPFTRSFPGGDRRQGLRPYTGIERRWARIRIKETN